MGIEWSAIRHDKKELFNLGKGYFGDLNQGTFPPSAVDAGLRSFATNIKDPGYCAEVRQRWQAWAEGAAEVVVVHDAGWMFEDFFDSPQSKDYRYTGSRYTEDWAPDGGYIQDRLPSVGWDDE